MFCKNCGNQMDPQAAICVKCGVPAGTGANFCNNCGAPLAPGAAVCTNCGVAQGPAAVPPQAPIGGPACYCRNCGNQMDPHAAVCIKCGVPAGSGMNFCNNCGAPSAPGAAVCTNCGVAFTAPIPAGAQKSKMAAGLLGIFLGGFGVHNFYLGFTGKAVAQLLISVLSCGTLAVGAWIWGFVEGIMILTGSISADANGVPLKD